MICSLVFSQEIRRSGDQEGFFVIFHVLISWSPDLL